MTNHSTTAPGGASAPDPLAETIAAYYAGLVDFRDNAPEYDEDAYAATSYGPPMQQLIDWSEPAKSRQSAIAALRLVISSLAVGDDYIAKPMALAALSFFEEEDRLVSLLSGAAS